MFALYLHNKYIAPEIYTVCIGKSVENRVSNRNSVAHYVAERNAIFTAISASLVAHIPHPLAPNLRLKVSFLAHQQCGILGAIKV